MPVKQKSKRGYYGTNKRGSGLITLEVCCFDSENNTDYIIMLSVHSDYPHNHRRSGEDNKIVQGSGYNKVKHTHIGHKDNYISYKDLETCVKRMVKAKEELESFGYEVEVKNRYE